MEKGVPIRAVTRSIAVLQAINRHGALTLMDIATEIKVPYPTACRIVQTLQVEGLIEREPGRKRYRPTALVHTLSHGFQTDDHLVTAARPHLVELTRQISWPVSLCTRVGQKMMVRDSTHSLTSLTFSNYYPGYTLPLLECASGRVYMAYCSQIERETVLEGLRMEGGPFGADVLPQFESGEMIELIREHGYATKGRNLYTENPGKTSSIAAPVFDGDRLVGTLSVIFFSASLKMPKAVEQFVPSLTQSARAISAALAVHEAPPDAKGVVMRLSPNRGAAA